MINTFNQNFICNDFKKIVKLYDKNISLSQYFKDVKILEEKYKHPLFKNYNYCLFCGEKARTKYYFNNLYNRHINLEEKTMGEFLINNKIKLREVKKNQKIAKRRFIKSHDNEKNDKYYNNQLPFEPNNQSDTELYVYDNNQFKPSKKKGSKKLNAWSLTALLKLMPKCIISTPNPLSTNYCCRNVEFDMEFYADNPVDAAFEMLVWLKENEKL